MASNEYAFAGPSARVAGPRSHSPASQPLIHQSPLGGSSGYRPSFEERTASPSGQFLLPPSSQYSNSASSDSISMHQNPFHSSSLPPSSGSISNKFSLAPDPKSWGAELSPDYHEFDDYLHTPDKRDSNGHIFTLRGLMNLGCLFILAAALITLFAGFPILSWFLKRSYDTLGGYNIGGINATGQVPQTLFRLIDADTPESAMTYTSIEDGIEWQLVFSDEFETEGRSFYPGDDPFWEAVDLHYWGTNNLEWYDPETLTTVGGSLQITLRRERNHGMQYMGGMMATWNKFCFTGGILLASVMLPGASDVNGLWPAVWAMGNLGRAGYGGSLDGMWPYTYEACDVGTLANQTLNGEPLAAMTTGDPFFDDELSYLPGQRLSACTCPGEPHPGPVNEDGTFVGRAAPEIDVIEAQVDAVTRIGHVSQSGQWAPFNAFYSWENLTYATIWDHDMTELNAYRGSVYQQASSGISITDQACYELSGGCFSEYGFEYLPGYEEDGAYITWINDGRRAWRIGAGGMQADPLVEISARPVPKEPMYIILNLGLSENFGDIDYANLEFPTHMLIDWVRVYQHPDRINIGCDPPGFPTNNYIERYIEAYTNPNITTWEQYGQAPIKNRLVDDC